MFARRARSGRRNSHGVASIRRDTYNSVDGFSKKGAWWEIRKRVWDRDGGRCRVLSGGKQCMKPASEVHHIIPLSRGGTTSMANLVCICVECHNKRHHHLLRSRG
jgi:5-methylcytosine-specific restriction endonuclease McrA